jgi:hypothetical protein
VWHCGPGRHISGPRPMALWSRPTHQAPGNLVLDQPRCHRMAIARRPSPTSAEPFKRVPPSSTLPFPSPLFQAASAHNISPPPPLALVWCRPTGALPPSSELSGSTTAAAPPLPSVSHASKPLFCRPSMHLTSPVAPLAAGPHRHHRYLHSPIIDWTLW